jgi:hypothetical protein
VKLRERELEEWIQKELKGGWVLEIQRSEGSS